MNQRPIVTQRPAGACAASRWRTSSSTEQGELALGQNVLVAFMSWEGWQLRGRDHASASRWCATTSSPRSTSRSTRSRRATPSSAPRRSPATSRTSARTALRDLDENGIIRIGAEVKPGDILVGKITPKGETELTAEERLLRAIFGEKAREVKDTSLRVPHGERGKVVDVRVFERDAHAELPAGVNKLVRVSASPRSGRSPRATRWPVATATRASSRGSCRSRTCRSCRRSTPVEIILNPIGVPSRMNVGQILETHLGWAAAALGVQLRDAGVRRRDRGRHPRGAASRPICPRTARSTLLRWAHRRGVRPAGDGRLHLHAEAGPPGGGQDPRPLDGAVLADHPAAAGRQGAVRRPALRRDGGVGAGGLRRGAHAPGDPHRQVRRRGRAA